jgi:hypothetical protein
MTLPSPSGAGFAHDQLHQSWSIAKEGLRRLASPDLPREDEEEPEETTPSPLDFGLRSDLLLGQANAPESTRTPSPTDLFSLD